MTKPQSSRLVQAIEAQMDREPETSPAYEALDLQLSFELGLPRRKNAQPLRVHRPDRTRDTDAPKKSRLRKRTPWSLAFPFHASHSVPVPPLRGQTEPARVLRARTHDTSERPRTQNNRRSRKGVRHHTIPSVSDRTRDSKDSWRELLACKRHQWATESISRYYCPSGCDLEARQARKTTKGWEVK